MARRGILERNRSIRFNYKAKVIKSSEQLHQIILEKLRSNESENLRSLHGRCCLFWNDWRHRRTIIKSLKKGVLCPNWKAELSGQVKK